jgi:hypothetical protein
MPSTTALGKVMTCSASGVSPRICKDRALSNPIRTVKTFESLAAKETLGRDHQEASGKDQNNGFA